MDDKNITKHLKIPAGKRKMEFDDKMQENHNNMSSFATNIDVGFCFDSDAFCAFGNMANAMHIMGDEKAARFFFSHRHKNMALLQDEYQDMKMKLSGNQFAGALQIVRSVFKYTIRNLGHEHEPWKNINDDEGVIKYVEMQEEDNVFTHVVCIHNGLIYDGCFKKALKLSRESMLWLCNDKEFYMKCYSIEASPKLKRALNAKLTQHKKQKH